MKLQADLDRAFAATADRSGETVMYSRPQGTQFNAVAPFPVTCFVNTSGEFASPTGPLAGAVTVRAGDIPGGAQKGDLIAWNGGTYSVRTISPDNEVGTSALGIRLEPQ